MLPRLVYQMCVNGALICGSYAKKLCGENITTNDFDLLVPYDRWQIISLFIPSNAHLNKFGGWRFTTPDQKAEEVEVDIWPSTIEKYLSECKTKYGGRVYVVDYIANRVF